MAASIIASTVTGGSNSHQTVAEEINNIQTDFVTQGVVGSFTSGSPNTGAFGITQDASPDMGVTVISGRAYVSGTPSGQDAQVLNARMTSNYTGYTINANSSGSTKYDWIYLQLSATNANNPSLAGDNVITLYTSRSTSNASDNGSPPTYGLLLGVVTVVNGASSITNGNITDKRVQANLSTVSSATTGWQTLSFPLTYGANNGSKEFTVTTPNNLTSTLSAGMKLQVTRSVTPPTQCMAFTSVSSQYATKASPSGITFTGAFTCEAWIYLQSYTGQVQTIIGRVDGGFSTGGWVFFVNASGQLRLIYGTTTNFTDFLSYQSIPLNTWIHVAGVVTSVASKTGQIYINGTAVTTFSSLTNSTTLTQLATDLRVGAYSSTPANSYFNGYISEARIWSTNQTSANIQANMAINLVGNETNLVALYQGSGNFNDSTSNANNLTATNGAIATQSNNPYNAIEYSAINTVSYSNPTTTITLDTGTQCTIPNQTLNSPQYSTAATPYGLTGGLQNNRTLGYAQISSNFSSSAASPTQVSGLTVPVTIPSGGQRIKITAFCGQVQNTTGPADAYISIWDGVVNSGTQLARSHSVSGTGTYEYPHTCIAIVTPPAGSKTYNVGIQGAGAGNTIQVSATNVYPSFIQVELIA